MVCNLRDIHQIGYRAMGDTTGEMDILFRAKCMWELLSLHAIFKFSGNTINSEAQFLVVNHGTKCCGQPFEGLQ
jgi:hypothetical protein